MRQNDLAIFGDRSVDVIEMNKTRMWKCKISLHGKYSTAASTGTAGRQHGFAIPALVGEATIIP